MKFLLSELLLISELFSIIRTGMSLRCFQNDDTEKCLKLVSGLKDAKQNQFIGTTLDVMSKLTIDCIKHSHKKFDLVTCNQTRKCSKLDVKFHGEDKMTYRFCDKSESGTVCKEAKILLKDNLEMYLENASWDYCHTDECNVDSKALKGPSPEIPTSEPEIKHNKSSSRSSSSCIQLSVFALFLILGAFFI